MSSRGCSTTLLGRRRAGRAARGTPRSSAGTRAGRCRPTARPAGRRTPHRRAAGGPSTSVHGRARVGQAQRGGDPGEAAADDDRARTHAQALRAMARAWPPAASPGSAATPPAHDDGGVGRDAGRAARGRCRPSRAQQAALRRSSIGSSCKPLVVPPGGPRGLEPDRPRRARRPAGRALPSGRRPQLDAEQVEIARGQVDPAVAARSSRMSRRMFVSCSATPSVSASRRARPRSLPAAAGRRPRARAGRSTRRRSGSSRRVRRGRRSCGRGTSISQPSTSSSNASSGMGSGRAASASATSTGSSGRAGAVAARRAARRARRSLSFVRQVAVADVVDAPRDRVHRGQRASLGGRQQPDAPGEVAGLLAGDPLALAVGGGDIGWRRCSRPSPDDQQRQRVAQRSPRDGRTAAASTS